MLRLVCSLVLCTLIWSGAAHAQDLQLDPFTPPPDHTGFTAFPSTRTPGHLGGDGLLWLDYGRDSVEQASTQWVRQRFAGALSAQLGLWGRGAIALRIPAVLFQAGDQPGLAAQAVGNPAIDGRVRVLGAPARSDGSVQDGTALAVRGVLGVPVGTSDAYLADRVVRGDLSLITDVEAFGLGAGAALGYRHRFSSERVLGVSYEHQLRLAGGLKIPFPLIAIAVPGKVQESALIEFDASTDPTAPFAKATTPVEARLSYRIAAFDFTFLLGAGAALTQALGVPDVRVLFGASYSPRKHDQDGDGVPDGHDQCVHLAEDLDGFEDADGCAEPDNDQDMILDEDDRCPVDPAEIGRDDDEDGCTDS